MTLSRKLMVEGEQTVLTTRTHVKVLVLPVLVLLVACGLGAFLAASAPEGGARTPVRTLVLVVAVVAVVWWTVIPFVRWLTSTYTITNKRLVEQRGILTRTGRIIPLSRVNDVAFEKNLDDRILGSGTLVIHDASEQSGLSIRDIPHVEDVHRTLTSLVFASHERPQDDEKI